ncbi:hypothetical protein [Desulfosudis oleivorans]|uniref:Uncharacterized protein n=1 Tax=Desulfosudis oleivorans (strain DSM 6200 / JCM 39069 / Hxd3) TaxID=96561 RepID=A8ZRV7_DESOH|nr:hypothetical protein [Desulfosudis oleivorans]ABW65874.1 hypothetical protein Dole_0064 [Desulfosudis oleivorans Hxd3]
MNDLVNSKAGKTAVAGMTGLVLLAAGCVYTPVKTNDISVNDFSCCNAGAKVYTNGLDATVIDEDGGLDIEKGQTWREISPSEMPTYVPGQSIAKQLTSIDPKTGATRLEATILQNENSLELYFEKTGKKYTVENPLSVEKDGGGSGSGGGSGGDC